MKRALPFGLRTDKFRPLKLAVRKPICWTL